LDAGHLPEQRATSFPPPMLLRNLDAQTIASLSCEATPMKIGLFIKKFCFFCFFISPKDFLAL